MICHRFVDSSACASVSVFVSPPILDIQTHTCVYVKLFPCISHTRDALCARQCLLVCVCMGLSWCACLSCTMFWMLLALTVKNPPPPPPLIACAFAKLQMVVTHIMLLLLLLLLPIWTSYTQRNTSNLHRNAHTTMMRQRRLQRQQPQQRQQWLLIPRFNCTLARFLSYVYVCIHLHERWHGFVSSCICVLLLKSSLLLSFFHFLRLSRIRHAIIKRISVNAHTQRYSIGRCGSVAFFITQFNCARTRTHTF